ncbi:MAG: hypothetical protein CVT59_05150 [Actinobacteria bacterium HGW-Actinobacteria-1]|jgi:nitrate reductase cytochrome c-type subunit|nr:MAG: hypothetical protein CVT59_05150 [Actinobacteria bacterium HGW-Actinobacteria-1]
MSVVRTRLAIAAVFAALMLAIVPGVAFGAQSTTSTVMPTTTATRSVSPTAPYALDFTLPTESKAGCMVCHGDTNLTRLKAGKTVSFYVDGEAYAKSIHAKTLCVGCHIDFAYTAPHDGTSDWQSTAKLACKNCHEKQFLSMGQGVHRRSVAATGAAALAEAKKPLCGDCHGGHDITQITDSPAGKAALHENGYQICGRCHQDYWDNYDDYYHGAAYKAGAEDAPACWDCHGWHDIRSSKDSASLVNKSHLVETCGTGDCHDQHGTASDTFIQDAAQMIHGKRAVRAENPLVVFFTRIFDGIGKIFGK